MRLIDRFTGAVLLEINGKYVIIRDDSLRQELETQGIFIPPVSRKAFAGKKKVLPYDRYFKKAFLEVYYPFKMNTSRFKWDKDSEE